MIESSVTAHDAIVVYESMFGGSRAIAEAIALGLGCRAVSIADAGTVLPEVSLLVAGAPTHARGLSTPGSREEAARWSADPSRGLHLEPGRERGMREWLALLESKPRFVAAFDTRVDMPQLFSGTASRSIEEALARRGATVLEPPRSYLVDGHSHLLCGEIDRAFAWGQMLRVLLEVRVDRLALAVGMQLDEYHR